MAWFAAALPVVPGKEGEARRRGELFRRFLAEYVRLNGDANLRRHLEFLQETPMGAVTITLYEFDGDGAALGRRFTDSDYDRSWLRHIKEVHGVDLSTPTPPPKVTLVHEWTKAGAA